MYFFLDNRIERLKTSIQRNVVEVEYFAKQVLTERTTKNLDPVRKKINEKAGNAFKIFKDSESKATAAQLTLNAKTSTVSGLLSSFFLPWTKEYKLREIVGENLTAAENAFSKLANYRVKLLR